MTNAAAPFRSPPALLGRLPGGAAAPRQTLHVMRFLVRKCKLDLALRRLAMEIVADVPQRDYAGQVRRLHAFVRDRIRYVGDIDGVETVHTPRQILEQRAGDCDDKSLLLATLLATIGHKTRFVAVGYGASPSHVLVETQIASKWIPLETTENVGAGWYPARVVRHHVVHN